MFYNISIRGDKVLKFIFGLPCSGKTYTTLQKIKELCNTNEETILIVPEQFSFESEKEVLKVLGDSFALKTTVLSFSRLEDEVSRKIGGICAKVLTDSDKVIFMNKTLIQVASELKVWAKYANSVTFAKTMLDTIGEFKINAVTCDDIKKAAINTDKISLKNKLLDLCLIYQTYDLLTKERFIDPADKLTKLYSNLGNYRYFDGKTVFIDSFKGFTGQQFKILERIISQAKDVYITFTNDKDSTSEFNVFTNIHIAIQKIENICKKYNVDVDEPLILKNSHYKSYDLKNVERLISGNDVNVEFSNSAITVCKANTVFDEAEFVARTIRKLVRTENYRFRDFVIIARDDEQYTEAIDYACQKNNVSCFFDRRLPLSALPISVVCDYAIKALNFSTENILSFLKSGISLMDIEDISVLENYTYMWNINGDIWLDEWDMDVRGFVTEKPTDLEISELEKINNLRKKAIEPILYFKDRFNSNAAKMSKAIIDLFDFCNLKNALSYMCDRFNKEENLFTADILKQGYDSFMAILDSLVVCFGERSLTTKEFHDALSLATSLETIGVIPQTLDEVTFGSADRIRPSRPKIAFILGANQGVFPRFSNNSGVFADRERKKIIELGIDISDNSIYTSIDENFLVYSNLCCATEKLYISYSKNTLTGDSLEPSAFVLSIIDNLNPILKNEPENLMIAENTPETEESVFSEYCRRINKTEEYLVLEKVLDSSNKNKIQNLRSSINGERNNISKENAQNLFGKNIYMSATKFDTFNRCKFSFFCKYGIKAKKIQPADFDVLQRGTIVHYVLERFISVYKENIKNLTENELDNLTDLYINEYLDSVIGYRSIHNSRYEFLVTKISRSLKEVIRHLAKEFSQSEFKPVACELKIGKEGIPLNFKYDQGEIIINGSIDRVDEYNGYIRIVDYKTGSKSFKLPDILFGLNLQMLLYLYAVIRADKGNDSLAAGILYMPSKRDLNDEGMAMNGLLTADINLITAMEKENKGEFIPILKTNKDGSISKTSNSFIEPQEFSMIFDYIEKLMKNTGNTIASGNIEISPTDGRESSACDYCDYKSVCGIEDLEIFKVPNLKNSEVFEKIKEAE